MSIKRPMKAPSDPITDSELYGLTYPIVGSPKLDGFRCIVDKTPLTSSMKQFPSLFVQSELSDPMYHGFDGELLVGLPNDPDAFHNTSGPIRQIHGKPDFRFYVFDYWLDGQHEYQERWFDRKIRNEGRLIVLPQTILRCPNDVIKYENDMLSTGYEGAMIRSLTGRYKEGRCSFRGLNIFKRKPFVDCEVIIVGFVEGMQNLNESYTDEMGRNVRSSHKENKVPKGTLGSFKLKSDLWLSEFTAGLGEGFTQMDKQQIWNYRENLLGKTVTIKYQKYGSRNAPRIANVTKIHYAYQKFDV